MDGHAIEHHVDSRMISDKLVALVFFLIVFHVAAFVSFHYVVMVPISISILVWPLYNVLLMKATQCNIASSEVGCLQMLTHCKLSFI